MAPSLVEAHIEPTITEVSNGIKNPTSKNGTLQRTPLKYSGSLDEHESFDVTNVIDKEFPNLQLSDILSDDSKIRDLAITVSQRGVVFFRNQDLTVDDQKVLGQKLGELTDKPETSKLHRHALLNSKRGLSVDENGRVDDEISIISFEQNRRLYEDRYKVASKHLASDGWHADITFERIPFDYAILKIIQPPSDAGGDTLWASGYEAYDRLSPAFKTLAESLTATDHQSEFNRTATKHGLTLIDDERGAPENTGLDLRASHPVVHPRGEPVRTELLKECFLRVIAQNHNLHVRFKWGKNDLAIWDNRSVFDTATNDYHGSRQGNRVVSLGEKPYFDPGSLSRREALSQIAEQGTMLEAWDVDCVREREIE